MDKIYKLIEPSTLKVRYIGYTNKPLDIRLLYHLRKSGNKKTRRYKWVQSLINYNKIPLIKLVKIVKTKTWQYWERYYIKKYRKLGFDLVNGTDGGDGITMTSEIRAKIGKSNKGKQSFLGKKHNNETKLKISKANKGKGNPNVGKLWLNKKIPKNICLKMSKSHRANKRGIKIEAIHIKTNITRIFSSANVASRVLLLNRRNINRYVNGKRKGLLNGYKFKKLK